MKFNSRLQPANFPNRIAESCELDDADWVEWEHWQAVEEIQDVMNGVANRLADTEEGAEFTDNRHRITSELERFGIQVDG